MRIKLCRNLLFTVSIAIAASEWSAARCFAADMTNPSLARVTVPEGTVHVPAFDFPPSEFLSAESQAAETADDRFFKDSHFDDFVKRCFGDGASKASDAISHCRVDWAQYMSYYLVKLKARYKVAIEAEMIGGVPTTIISPLDGVSAANRHRVLVDVAGPDMTGGTRGQMESIAIAAVGRIKIVSVDFREAELSDLATGNGGKEDLAAVYKVLLQKYAPRDIGIFGCSGARMEEMAWFQKKGLPMPGAIGILSAPPFLTTRGGDSGTIDAALSGFRPLTESSSPERPLFPTELTPEVMARFPATLLITGTRDKFMSAIVVAQSRLAKVRVETDLHVWEGMQHGFLFNPDIPESLDVYDVIVRFFDEHLGRVATTKGWVGRGELHAH
jgi:hypothetical protein